MTVFPVNSMHAFNSNNEAFEIMDNKQKVTYFRLYTQHPEITMPETKAHELFKFLGAEYDKERDVALMPCDSKFEIKLTIMYQVNLRKLAISSFISGNNLVVKRIA
jgi:hypothetical protein